MNSIKFLGTAGARIVVAKQLRASGGMWLSLDGTNLLLDPGPGCLVQCFASRPKLDPTILDGIVLSHKHLDHAADINVMMEAMTLGGHNKKGMVIAPQDALEGNDPIIYKYVRPYVRQIEELKLKKNYRIGEIKIKAVARHKHGVDTYGLVFKAGGRSISYITDTRYFDGLEDKYENDLVIINVLSTHPLNIDHLSLLDAEKIIQKIKPRLTILTHFGRWLIKAGPGKVAKEMQKKLQADIIAAEDGMTVDIPALTVL